MRKASRAVAGNYRCVPIFSSLSLASTVVTIDSRCKNWLVSNKAMKGTNTETTATSTRDLDRISRVIADTASDAIITIDAQSTILYANRGAEKIFGYRREEMLSQSLTMLMPDYLRHVHRAGLQRYLSTGERHISWEAVELPGLHKSGKEIALELSFGEFIEGDEKFFTGIARDITDQKAAREALKHREEYFRSLIENTAEIITVLNRDGTRRYVSPSIKRSLGYDPEELVGKDPFGLIHPEDANELMKLYLAELSNPGFTATRNFRIRHKDGSWRIYEATGHNLLEDPAVRGIVINSRDITNRKRLEQRLTAQFQTGRVLSEADTLHEAAPRLLRAICESLGWKLGQFWGRDREAEVLNWVASWSIPPQNETEFEEASRHHTFVLGAGLPGRIWASGQPDWISDLATDTNFPRASFAISSGLRSAFGFPILLGSEVFGVIEIFSDETESPDQRLLDMMTGIGNQIGQFIERKRAEAKTSQLYDREQRARHEVEAAIDRMRRVQTVTESALAHLSLDELLADLLNRVRDAMTVDTVVILLHEPESDELVAWAAKGLEEEVDLGVRIPMGLGFAGKIAVQKSPVMISDLEQADLYNDLLRRRGIQSLLGVPLLVEGRLLGVIHVGKFVHYQFTEDDTRLLQLVADRIALAIDNARLFEEERAARREAEAASRAKDEFLTTISHELRTPLTPVIGWIHMIRNGMLPTLESEHGLEVIEKNSLILKRLINDLLDMSAILSGKMRMEELPVPLAAVLREAVETVRPIAAASKIELNLQVQNCATESVTGDRARLLQVFWNLVSNAIKFSSPGGKVKVRCEVVDKQIIVRVEDTGQGIAADFLPYVFERFRQADGSKTRAHGGLGLGLALVKSFVEAHRGTVEAESAGPGAGSRFTVRLPRQVAQTAHPDIKAVRSKATAAPAHLLIIEDDEDTLEMLRATLEAQGFRVTGFVSATETLDVLPKNSVDLIISDIGMPVMDGLEMMRRLRELPEYTSVPSIALSGYASQKDAATAKAAGFSAHVSKPVDPRELISLVNKLLRAKSETDH